MKWKLTRGQAFSKPSYLFGEFLVFFLNPGFLLKLGNLIASCWVLGNDGHREKGLFLDFKPEACETVLHHFGNGFALLLELINLTDEISVYGCFYFSSAHRRRHVAAGLVGGGLQFIIYNLITNNIIIIGRSVIVHSLSLLAYGKAVILDWSSARLDLRKRHH